MYQKRHAGNILPATLTASALAALLGISGHIWLAENYKFLNDNQIHQTSEESVS